MEVLPVENPFVTLESEVPVYTGVEEGGRGKESGGGGERGE